MSGLVALALLAATGPFQDQEHWLAATPLYLTAAECRPEAARTLGIGDTGGTRPENDCRESAAPAAWRITYLSARGIRVRLVTADEMRQRTSGSESR